MMRKGKNRHITLEGPYGRAVVRGTRIGVDTLKFLVKEKGITPREIVEKHYTYLCIEDVAAAVKWKNDGVDI